MTVAASLFPGGVNSPVRAYRAVGGEPPNLVRGAGAFVWDESGRRYIDYVGAFGPLVLGHAHPAVVGAIAAAAEAGGSFGVTSGGAGRPAQLIFFGTPLIDRVKIVHNRPDATMAAAPLRR